MVFAFISGNLAVRSSLERAVLTAQYDQASVMSRYILNWSEQRAGRLDRQLTELEVAVSSASEAASDLERRLNDGNNQVSQSFENIKSILSMMRAQATPVEMPQRSGWLFQLFSPAHAQTALSTTEARVPFSAEMRLPYITYLFAGFGFVLVAVVGVWAFSNDDARRGQAFEIIKLGFAFMIGACSNALVS